MGILGKVMFWKKKDDFSDLGLDEKRPFGNDNLAFGNDFGMGTGLGQPGMGQSSQGFSQQPSPGMGFSQPAYPQPSYPGYQPSRYEPQQDMASKNLEIISSKLDALRASIESLNQRLANLEVIARGEEERPRRRYY